MRSLVGALVLLAACKHDDGMATGTATIRSGSPGGPKVTNLRAPEPLAPAVTARARMGDELARALCKHERECGLAEAETRLLEEEVCFSNSRGGTRASLEQWPCEPSHAREGFDRCLAAIHEADCTGRIGESAQIPACRASEICRRSEASP